MGSLVRGKYAALNRSLRRYATCTADNMRSLRAPACAVAALRDTRLDAEAVRYRAARRWSADLFMAWKRWRASETSERYRNLTNDPSKGGRRKERRGHAMWLKRWIKRILLGIAALLGLVVVLVAAFVGYVWFSSVPTTNLDTEKGQVLLRRSATVDYEALTQNWVLQGQMLCCAAAAANVMNSLEPEAGYTQYNLFVPETAHIITLDEFQNGQNTLDKLAALIRTRSGLSATANHAGSGPREGDLASFRRQVRETAATAGGYMILNYSRGFLSGLGTGGGHCAPVAGYDEEEDLVLLLDPRGEYQWNWIATASVYEAMNTIDAVSQVHRGWVTVTK